jgi:chemotaxis signal transduction protein
MTREASAPRRGRLLAFRRGSRVLGVDSRHSREVTPLGFMTPVPLAPAPLLGVANLRGVAVPVIDLAPLLGFAAEPWSLERLAHLTVVDGVTAAFAIDEVAGFDPWPAGEPAALDPREPALLRAVSRGAIPFRAGEVIVLDLAAVLRSVRELFAAGDRRAAS